MLQTNEKVSPSALAGLGLSPDSEVKHRVLIQAGWFAINIEFPDSEKHLKLYLYR